MKFFITIASTILFSILLSISAKAQVASAIQLLDYLDACRYCFNRSDTVCVTPLQWPEIAKITPSDTLHSYRKSAKIQSKYKGKTYTNALAYAIWIDANKQPYNIRVLYITNVKKWGTEIFDQFKLLNFMYDDSCQCYTSKQYPNIALYYSHRQQYTFQLLQTVAIN